MGKTSARDIKPFISVIILITALLGLVFCKMEVRRMGYSVLKLSQIEKTMMEHKRIKLLQLARLTQPSHLDKVAKSELTLKRAEKDQIIMLSSGNEENHMERKN